MEVRDETAADAAAIAGVVAAAFAGAEHSSGTEAAIVAGLRDAGALTISLVADDGALVGHVAVSPVRIGESSGWYGLGPVSVRPEAQRRGIGSALVRAALERLAAAGAAGCVVVGDPGYYGRFGFEHHAGLSYGDLPPLYLQALAFGDQTPAGEVTYHPAFAA